MRRRRTRRQGPSLLKTALVAGAASKMASNSAARRHAAAAEQHKGHKKASPGMITDEVVDQLKKLAELRDAGVLTEREFAAKKAKLLPALKK